jgi:hypothetical protein
LERTLIRVFATFAFDGISTGRNEEEVESKQNLHFESLMNGWIVFRAAKSVSRPFDTTIDTTHEVREVFQTLIHLRW